jgi:hypothetical protein
MFQLDCLVGVNSLSTCPYARIQCLFRWSGIHHTADFQSSAADIAVELGFPRIGLVNGLQLVDLLVERWNDKEFQDLLGLSLGD